MWLRNMFVIYKAIRKPLMHYADDTQFHDSCKSSDAAVLAARAMRVIRSGRERLDVIEPAQTEHRQDTVHLARNEPLSFLDNGDTFSYITAVATVTGKTYCMRGRNGDDFLSPCSPLRRSPCWRSCTPSSQAESIIVTVSFTGRMDIFRPTSIHLNSAARLILGVPKFDAFPPPSTMNFTGCRLGNASSSKSLSPCDIVSPEYLTELCRPVSSSSGRQSLLCLAWWSHSSKIPTSKIWLQGFRCLWAPCVELSSDRN